jgi:tripartite-type tricarboxylate transporter receptor subunit TctC
LLALFLAGTAARAEDYPGRPLRFLVGFTPGGPSDVLARTIGQKLGERLGQPVVADNRPGAGGNLAAEIVAKAPADGYTLLMGNIGILAANPALYRHLTYDPTKDFTPVILVGDQPNVLVVNPAVPARSVAQLIGLARASPGRLNYASSGNGSPSHLTAELFKTLAQVDIVNISYRGAVPALTDLIAGQGVQLMFATSVSGRPFIEAGKLRALAVTTVERAPAFSDLPTMTEAGVPGCVSTTWHGVVVAAGTPEPIVERLNREIDAILRLPDVRQTLAIQGVDIIGGPPATFSAYIAAEGPKWAEIVRLSGAHVD